MQYVYARDGAQFRAWQYETQARAADGKHIDRPGHDLRGLPPGTEIVLYGTYWLRPDYDEFRDYVKVMNLETTPFEEKCSF